MKYFGTQKFTSYHNILFLEKPTFFVYSILFLLAIFLLPLGCDKNTKLQSGSVAIQAKIILYKSQKALEIHLKLPPHSHVYLDRGERENLVPVSFDWKSMLQKGWLSKEPQLISQPKSQHDKKVKASVMRKEGSFIFIGKPQEIDGLVGKELRVKTQVCDEVKGICYRPEWNSIFIKAE